MTGILLQSVITERKGARLAEEALQIRQRCSAEHGGKASLVECPDCFGTLLDAARARYLSSPDQEWFSARRTFLDELDAMFVDAKEYQLDPSAIEERMREERCQWFAENVRTSLLRFMVEDPATREAVFDKLVDIPAQQLQSRKFVDLAADVVNILGQSPLLARETGLDGVAERLLDAEGPEARIEVLKEAFFTSVNGADATAVPEEHQKYLEMLRSGSSMEQVADRILGERQAAVTSREQNEKLTKRLYELKRARAAHELVKSKRESKRARLAEQVEVPDDLYEIPPCLKCNKVPDSRDFICCPICTILVSHKVQDIKPVVYCCAEHDEHVRNPPPPQ